MRGLKDKVAIVTGGLGDIGYASAGRLVEEGCKVAIFDAREDDESLAEKINCRFFKVDIREENQVEEACKAVASSVGDVSVLVNCAAVFVLKSIDASPEDWQKTLSVNVMGTSLVTKHVVPLMEKIGSGSIVNFSSISGYVGQANFATYNATKFAIRGLTKCWAQDLAPKRIRVNSICPGFVITTAFENTCKQFGLDYEEEKRNALTIQLLPEVPTPEGVAAGVAFLASDDSSIMTGSDLIVDAGYLAK